MPRKGEFENPVEAEEQEEEGEEEEEEEEEEEGVAPPSSNEEKQDSESQEKKPLYEDEDFELEKSYDESELEDEKKKDEDDEEKEKEEEEDASEDGVDAEAVRIRSGRKDRTTAAKQRMMQLLDGSSVSGLGHATGAPSVIARLIWSVLLICGVVGLITNLTFLFSRFLKKPVLTTYIAESQNFHWPDITFCNHMNPIHFWKHPNMAAEWNQYVARTKRLSKLRYGGRTFPDMEHVLAMSSIDPAKFHIGGAKAMVFRLSARTKNNEISSSAGYFERFHKLKWNSSEFHARSVPTPFPTPCYTFNPIHNNWLMEMERQNKSLRTLKFNIIMNFDSYAIFNSSYENRGIYMYIRERGRTVSSSDIIQLSPGSTTTVQLSMSIFERLQDRAKCAPEAFRTKLYDADMIQTRIYNGSYDDCRHYVSQTMFLKFCGCYNPMLPIHESSQSPPRLCFNMSIFSPPSIKANFECLNRAMTYYSTGDYFAKELNRRCLRYKKPACTSIAYKMDQITRRWPADLNGKRTALLTRFAKYMGVNVTTPGDGVSYVRRNFAVVEINKRYSKAKLIKEEYEYPVPQLISDIGGTLGLWVGLSFVGVFELVEILLVIINYIISECMVEKKAYNAQKRITKRRQSRA